MNLINLVANTIETAKVSPLVIGSGVLIGGLVGGAVASKIVNIVGTSHKKGPAPPAKGGYIVHPVNGPPSNGSTNGDSDGRITIGEMYGFYKKFW